MYCFVEWTVPSLHIIVVWKVEKSVCDILAFWALYLESVWNSISPMLEIYNVTEWRKIERIFESQENFRGKNKGVKWTQIKDTRSDRESRTTYGMHGFLISVILIVSKGNPKLKITNSYPDRNII